MDNKKHPPYFGDTLFSLLILLIWMIQLQGDPTLGISNNGDFGRISERFGINVDAIKCPSNILCLTHEKDGQINETSLFFSSDFFIIAASDFFNSLFYSTSQFSIQSVGWIASLLFFISTWWVFRSVWLNFNPLISVIVSLVYIFFFTDFALVAFANSFLTELASFIFANFFIGYYLRFFGQTSPPTFSILSKALWLLAFIPILFILVRINSSILDTFLTGISVIILLHLAGILYWGILKNNQQIGQLFIISLISLLFISSKYQNILIVPPILVFLIVVFRKKIPFIQSHPPKKWFLNGLFIFFLASPLYFSFFQLQFAPKQFHQSNLYNAFFQGILLQKEGETAWEYFQLEKDDWEKFRDIGPWDPRSFYGKPDEAPYQTFFSKVTRSRIFAYYLTHPTAYFDLLELQGKKAFVGRYNYLAYYNISNNQDTPYHHYLFSNWSYLKQLYFPKSFLWILVYFSFTIFLILVNHFLSEGIYFFYSPTKKQYLQKLGFLQGIILIMMVLQWMFVPLGDWFYEIEKHLFLFNWLFDFSLLFNLVILLGLVVRPKR